MSPGDAGRRSRAIVLALLVGAMDYGALDDITTGREPSLWLEWTFLLASVPVFFLLWRWASRQSAAA
jgi:hypothetical protein